MNNTDPKISNLADSTGWETVSLANICNIVMGQSPASSTYNDEGKGLPFFQGKAEFGRLHPSVRKWCSDPKKIAEQGDILLSIRAPVGPSNIAAEKCIIGRGLAAIRGREPIHQDYVFHFIRKLEPWLAQQGTGSTFAAISGEFIRSIEIPLAPIAEQYQIATKLDELLAQVDSIKTRLDAIPNILKRFRQSVLAAAVSGKLTEDWRLSSGQFDVTNQIEAILIDRQKILGSKKKPVSHLANEEFEVPSGWQWVSLDALSSKIVDGTHHTPTYVENGVPFISVKDIKNGNIDFSETKFITKDEHEELCKRCKPEIGDLLITKSGTIGRTAIINTDKEFSLFVSVALIKPASKKCNMRFINLTLQKWVNEIDVSSRIVGSAIKNLHLVDIRVLAIPFPPIQEQTEIVRRTDQLFVFADQIERRVKDAQSRVNHLTQAILAKAFRGELTADWRAQNPDLISGENSAESLLSKIKAVGIQNKRKN